MALPIDTCGDTLPPGTPGPDGRDTALPSTCEREGSGRERTSPLLDLPPALSKETSRAPEDTYLPTLLRRGSRFMLSSFVTKSSSAREVALPFSCFFVRPVLSGGSSSSYCWRPCWT